MRNRGWDIAYLDPPYNQHQYGSNYHLLTTIARWDKPPVDCSVDERGVLKKKAAIRADWVKTRSEYCYRHSAKSAFAGLLDSLDAAHILLSYSTEGIIPFDELLELCSGRGELEIVTDRYTKYPGGKQSIKRLVGNIEFVLIVHGRRETSGGSLRKIQDVLLRRRLGLLLEKNYSLVRLARNFVLDGTAMTARLPGSRVTFHTRGFFMLVPPFQLDDLIGDELGELVARLAESACRDKQEELAEIFRIIGEGGCDQGFFVMKIPGTLKKFAHKKYRSIFLDWLERTKKTAKELPRLFAPIEGKIRALEELSRKRFSG
jgi:adenine-specific DNA-methyltransferase